MAELITGRIYIIRSPNTDMVYIGSTTGKLNKRFNKHHSDWRRDSKKGSSFLILEKGESYIELIEEVQVENKRELDILEQKWIERTPNNVNKNKAYISKEGIKKRQDEFSKKYYQDHKERILENLREHRKKNKEIICEKNKDKVPCKVCDCFITKKNKGQHERTKKHQKHLENVDQDKENEYAETIPK